MAFSLDSGGWHIRNCVADAETHFSFVKANVPTGIYQVKPVVFHLRIRNVFFLQARQ
jgi:hypothetical protein